MLYKEALAYVEEFGGRVVPAGNQQFNVQQETFDKLRRIETPDNTYLDSVRDGSCS